ncbi:MAG: NAD(P)H-dependent oxidoreductase [Rhizobiaceae bacterium]|nr:NAD(P)H-dependent oxidoreductase [Rhizobiaceae bacterium]
MAMRLNIIVTSTRPGRIGLPVGRWIHEAAKAHGGFDAHLADLAAFALPLYDEPHHPRLRRYEHEHTKRWSESVEAADAFVLVTPEYNHAPAPSLLNALDYVFHEWAYKPAAFVSYGGVSGGLRAVQAAKPALTALKVMPVPEAVVIPMVSEQVQDGSFRPKDLQVAAANSMFDELKRWAEALAPLRQKT